MLELISAAEAVKATLRDRLGLSEGRFAALVALFARDPSPITSADLATHAGVSRSAITDVLDRLEADQLILRHRDTVDRRIIYVSITPVGRAEVDAALTRFLRAAGHAAREVSPATFELLHTTLAQFHEGAADSAAQLPSAPFSA